MKKFLLLIVSIVMLTSSCEKLNGGAQQSKYSASYTAMGMLNVELLSGEKCVLYFTGDPENSGYYHTKGDGISIIGSVYTTDNWGASKWDCLTFSSVKPGKIYSSTSFGVDARSTKKDKTYYRSFTRHD